MVKHGGSSAGSYLADPTSPIPSHCASIVTTSTLRVKRVMTVALYNGEFQLTTSPTKTLAYIAADHTQITCKLICSFALKTHEYRHNYDDLMTLIQ